LVCLDTSILVALIRKESKVLQKLREIVVENPQVSTTIICVCELYTGAYNSSNPGRELERINEVLSALQILQLDDKSCRRFGELANSLQIKGNPVGDFDLLIASITIEANEVLATRNTRHFQRVPQLNIQSW
jgi:tRNA(fMet)-specific endonuclease VapC